MAGGSSSEAPATATDVAAAAAAVTTAVATAVAATAVAAVALSAAAFARRAAFLPRPRLRLKGLSVVSDRGESSLMRFLANAELVRMRCTRAKIFKAVLVCAHAATESFF